MLQHRLHDAVGTFAVLGDLFQVALVSGADDVITSARTVSVTQRRWGRAASRNSLDQFDGQRGEIVDEVQRVLDLVRDAGGSSRARE